MNGAEAARWVERLKPLNVPASKVYPNQCWILSIFRVCQIALSGHQLNSKHANHEWFPSLGKYLEVAHPVSWTTTRDVVMNGNRWMARWQVSTFIKKPVVCQVAIIFHSFGTTSVLDEAVTTYCVYAYVHADQIRECVMCV